MSIESVMPSSHLILCRPLLLLPPIPPSIRVFSNESTLHMRWPKYWSFSFSIIPSKETPGLISFRMDWLDLLAVQGTLKSLLQHHNSKASILRRSDTNVPLVSLIFLKRSLVFPILLFSSISSYWSLMLSYAFLSLLAILWNSAFRCLYLSLSFLPLASLLSSGICKASSENHVAFLHFFFLAMVL